MSNFMSHKKSERVMGRPKIGTENAKGVFFSIRFTPTEAAQINEKIRKSRQTKSEWTRKTLLSASYGA
jgi:hypothetical protein